jgi:hypothetical protein
MDIVCILARKVLLSRFDIQTGKSSLGFMEENILGIDERQNLSISQFVDFFHFSYVKCRQDGG